jgi:hypothetical protein
MKVKNALAMAGIAATIVAWPGQAAAAAPEQSTETELVHDVIGTCGPRDDLVGDYRVTQTATTFASGRQTLHLELVGTITRSGTGVVGKYAERQRDFGYTDGSERYVGLLGHLVVQGGRGFTFAGQAQLSPDGTLLTTHGLAGLADLDFDAAVCDALAR